MNANTDAILLLTSHFSNGGGAEDVRPLTPSEWGRFAFWLHEQGRRPSDLLQGDLVESISEWNDQKIPLIRIQALLGRGHALALAMEKWSRAGIWILTRSDTTYPRLLKHHLKGSAPAVLYGCGNQNLLGASSIAVVGSRNANEQDLADAHVLGRQIASASHAVVSGGAKGVDETAMLGALGQGGTAIGILADSLLRAATSRKWRDGLLSGDLVLASPYHPEASFSAGNAMGRNKHVYCLSKAAIVVHSGSKGGTWAGAEENLKKAWVPLWIKATQDPLAANAQLVGKGASWLTAISESLDIDSLYSAPGRHAAEAVLDMNNVRIAEDAGEFPAFVDREFPLTGPLTGGTERTVAAKSDVELAGSGAESAQEAARAPQELTFYELFLLKLHLHDQDFTSMALVESLDLPKKLVDQWLAKAVAEGAVVQSGKRPAKYRSAAMDLIR